MSHRDPLLLYAFAIREGDFPLADLLHRRFLRAGLAERILRTLRARLST
jgi:hypothetical protein